MKGLFIVFEGIDGSGTTTQSSLLAEKLTELGYVPHLTSEPSSGPIGNMIRQSMKGRIVFSEKDDVFDMQMAYLFAADRFDHLHNTIDGVLKLVDQGKIVISTRYYFSSYAYHVKTNDQESMDIVRELNHRFPQPDLVIYLRNTVERSMSRMQSRSVKDAYENEKKLSAVLKSYEIVFSNYDGKKVLIDAGQSVAVIHQLIMSSLKGILE